MTEQKRPNVVGKGPALVREMLDIFSDIAGNTNGMSDLAKEKIAVPLEAKIPEFEKIIKMAYLKTVKAGEVAWDLKEKSLALKEKIGTGDETAALSIMDEMDGELDGLIHKIKTFVVRMT